MVNNNCGKELDAETVRENAVVRIALRVAKDLDATDEEWEDFMRRLKENRGEGGR
ncbi:hypothetical protein V6615_01240 [Oscillospiraceae bacterium PP1C4]